MNTVPAAWLTALSARGFAPEPGGFRGDGVWFYPDARWLQFETTSSTTPDLGRNGLWRTVHQGGRARRRAELPADAVACAAEAPDECALSFAALLDWIMASAHERLPEGWRPPARQCVMNELPADALTLRVGPLVRQGELVLEPTRWALRFPIVPVLSDTLPASRARWLQRLAGDAMVRWRMVRTGIGAFGGQRALLTEVDLTGAPLAAPLLLAGLDGLRYAVAWLVEAADLLADVTVTLRALELAEQDTTKTQRNER